MQIYTQKAYLYTAIVVLGGLIFGLDAGIIVGALKYIRAEFDLTPAQVGTVVGAPGFGAIIAMIFIGKIVSTIGRKRALLLIAFLYFFSSVGSAFCFGYYSLLGARLIGGLAFTSLGLSSMYIGEVSPSHIRGKAVSGVQLAIAIGFLCAYLISYNFTLYKQAHTEELATSFFFSDAHIWRVMIGSTIVPCALWFLALLTVPESPRWLMLQDRFEEAEKVVKLVNPPEVATEVIAEIRANVEYLPKIRVWEQILRLFDGKMKKILIIGFGLSIAQSMAGMGVISYYAPMIFEQAGLGGNSAAFQTVLVGVVGIFASIATLFIVDRFGRRLLYIAGAIAILVAHGSLYYGFHKMSYDVTQNSIVQVQKIDNSIDVSPLQANLGKSFPTDVKFKAFLKENYPKKVLDLKEATLIKATAVFGVSPKLIVSAVFLFKIAFFVSIGPLLWVMFSEVLPNSVRSIGIPLFNIVGAVGAWATQKFFPWQVANLGSANTFLLYTVLAVICLIFIVIFVPETKGKTIESIEEMLMDRK